ncbi:hypothetical protein [Stenomitos frigidus]|uniref:hypothetical protein n=1 Tax=Stenomitos frigidus TaxID=1886765 RepID=UPI001C626304|nr:hypothetical protein [Stenomitos frigidus]
MQGHTSRAADDAAHRSLRRGSDWGRGEREWDRPGVTAPMAWAPAPDDSNCTWQVCAVYQDGTATPFDFGKEPHREFSP